MRQLAFSAALIFTLAGQASAQFVTGNQLLQFCDQYPTSASGYVLGTVDTILVSQQNGHVKRTVCLRDGANGGQLVDIVCQYLKATPTFRDFGGPALVSMALADAFPCL